jgi:hypothetical protein
MTNEKDATPYWNVNVPKEQWTDTPSEALANVDKSVKEQLSVWDEDYHIMSWEDVQDVIRKLSIIYHRSTTKILFIRRKQVGALQENSI